MVLIRRDPDRRQARTQPSGASLGVPPVDRRTPKRCGRRRNGAIASPLRSTRSSPMHDPAAGERQRAACLRRAEKARSSMSADLRSLMCRTNLPFPSRPFRVIESGPAEEPAHRRRTSTGRLIVRNCAPDCALTSVDPRQTPSLTRKHGERPPRS